MMPDTPPVEYPAPGAFQVGLDVFGVSRHSNHDFTYRQRNPGLGLTIAGSQDDTGFDWLAAAGRYIDSYDYRASYVLIGPRYTQGAQDGLHGALALEFGWLDGSQIRGPTLVPVLQFGYGRIALCVTGSPESHRDGTNYRHDARLAPSATIAFFVDLTLYTGAIP